jgi:hypothetical protein
MSILYFILALFACAISGVTGAFGMRFFIERNREIAEQEDPRDTKIRGLQAKINLATKEMTANQASATSATEHVKLAHDRINELLNELQSVKSNVKDQEALRSDGNEEKDILRDRLSVATQQLDTLRQRNQELEVELSVTQEPDMLSTQDSSDEIDESGAADEEFDDPFIPAVADSSPSLIHALTDELDRWKRHCQVLGGELKNQRSRITENSEATVDQAATTPNIDELTDIRGIGPALARKLHLLDIYCYKDLLNLDDDQMERTLQLIPDFQRRMERDDWLEQAQMLHESKYPRSTAQTSNLALT